MIAALYVETDGQYFGLEGVDPWDQGRDARLYKGPYPVVAHPPCNRWSTIAPINEALGRFKVGDDGGCFAAALATVRAYGGVLEHPARSYAWAAHNLPKPARGGWSRSWMDEGWVTHVYQGHYGHPAAKPTWLYAVGCDLPSLRWGSRPVSTAKISNLDSPGRRWTPTTTTRNGAQIRGSLASYTPSSFRDVLIQMARSAA